MKLTPHQILQKLGFAVPPEGVEVNPDNMHLLEAALEMAGKSINLDAIPDAEFQGLHDGTSRSAKIARTMASSILFETFKLTPH